MSVVCRSADSDAAMPLVLPCLSPFLLGAMTTGPVGYRHVPANQRKMCQSYFKPIGTSLHLLILLLLLASFCSPAASFAARSKGGGSSNSKSRHHLRNSSPDRRLTSASITNSTILIDVENVRGKSGFELSHGQLLDRCTVWADRRGLYGRVMLFVDHGSEPSGYWLQDRGVGVVFAGPSLKADDAIARDVSYFQREFGLDCVVITADRELMRRCHRASSRSGRARLELVPPGNFLEDLERVVYDRMQDQQQSISTDASVDESEDTGNDEDDPVNELAAEIERKMEREIQLWGQVVDTEIQLKRRGGSQKKKQKLSKQLYSLKEKLAAVNDGPSTLERVTVASPASGSGSAVLPRELQNDLMSRWEGRRKNSLRAERTGDRVVLAELLRRNLDVITSFDGSDNIDGVDDALYPASAHSRYVNVLAGRLFSSSRETRSTLTSTSTLLTDSREANTAERSLKPLRFVVISDTHGYEQSLTAEGAPLPWDITSTAKGDEGEAAVTELLDDKVLPHGDVLLHLGDFAVDASSTKKRDALVKFDKFLSKQPHATKIVVRGNHDPFTVAFPYSNATYVNTPREMNINGWKLSIVPYLTHRRYKVPPCDLLATHIPPKAILDRCESGALAGCSYLRSSVEKMAEKPPMLWVCGHIHEARGSKWTRFGGTGTPETLVVNAANANPGIACALIHGPVIAELNGSSDEHGSAFVTDEAPAHTDRFDWDLGRSFLDVEVPEGVGQLLLAVDLGLRMGAAMFNEQGKVIRYEQFHFDCADDLHEHIPVLFENWEEEANKVTDTEKEIERWSLTHVAIEGGDVTLLDAWRSAVETDDYAALPRGGRGARLHTVRPEEWRADLLTKKERTSGRKAKEAARLIARQVVGDYGFAEHEGKFKTDVAEAVTLGFHMSRRLGWMQSNVRRASNGMVLTPK